MRDDERQRNAGDDHEHELAEAFYGVFQEHVHEAPWMEIVASPVIASEAKQSRGREERLDCFVAPLLAMTTMA
jgi:hypothetical protein